MMGIDPVVDFLIGYMIGTVTALVFVYWLRARNRRVARKEREVWFPKKLRDGMWKQ